MFESSIVNAKNKDQQALQAEAQEPKALQISSLSTNKLLSRKITAYGREREQDSWPNRVWRALKLELGVDPKRKIAIIYSTDEPQLRKFSHTHQLYVPSYGTAQANLLNNLNAIINKNLTNKTIGPDRITILPVATSRYGVSSDKKPENNHITLGYIKRDLDNIEKHLEDGYTVYAFEGDHGYGIGDDISIFYDKAYSDIKGKTRGDYIQGKLDTFEKKYSNDYSKLVNTIIKTLQYFQEHLHFKPSRFDFPSIFLDSPFEDAKEYVTSLLKNSHSETDIHVDILNYLRTAVIEDKQSNISFQNVLISQLLNSTEAFVPAVVDTIAKDYDTHIRKLEDQWEQPHGEIKPKDAFDKLIESTTSRIKEIPETLLATKETISMLLSGDILQQLKLFFASILPSLISTPRIQGSNLPQLPQPSLFAYNPNDIRRDTEEKGCTVSLSNVHDDFSHWFADLPMNEIINLDGVDVCKVNEENKNILRLYSKDMNSASIHIVELADGTFKATLYIEKDHGETLNAQQWQLKLEALLTVLQLAVAEQDMRPKTPTLG